LREEELARHGDREGQLLDRRHELGVDAGLVAARIDPIPVVMPYGHHRGMKTRSCPHGSPSPSQWGGGQGVGLFTAVILAQVDGGQSVQDEWSGRIVDREALIAES